MYRYLSSKMQPRASVSSCRSIGKTQARRDLALLSIALFLHALALPGCVSYKPQPIEAAPFMDRAVTEEHAGLSVSTAALGQKESADLFGVPLANNGIQPVWFKIDNGRDQHYAFFQYTVDPDYYSASEAAYKSRYSPVKRVFGYGLAALILFPLLLAAPFQYFSARSANNKMETLFRERAIGNQIIEPGGQISGFMFTHLDEGTKKIDVQLSGAGTVEQFHLLVQVPGVRLDHHEFDAESLYDPNEIQSVSWSSLRQALSELPCCTANAKGDPRGDPVNLIVVGDFDLLLEGFTRAGWDETELIDVASSARTAWSFMFGSHYRYSPVSNLYLYGRKQDVAFQKARGTIHQRNHVRLWLSPMSFAGQPIWVSQVSRDIGVKFTTKTWNLTTHVIDADIDDSRDNLVGELLQSKRVSLLGYVDGVGPSTPDNPRRNLMGDPYSTDGFRAVVILSGSPVEARVFSWEEPDPYTH